MWHQHRVMSFENQCQLWQQQCQQQYSLASISRSYSTSSSKSATRASSSGVCNDSSTSSIATSSSSSCSSASSAIVVLLGAVSSHSTAPGDKLWMFLLQQKCTQCQQCLQQCKLCYQCQKQCQQQCFFLWFFKNFLKDSTSRAARCLYFTITEPCCNPF